MIQKSTLLQVAKQLPAEFTLDDLIDRLILFQKIEDAQQQSQAGLGIPQEEARKRIPRRSK